MSSIKITDLLPEREPGLWSQDKALLIVQGCRTSPGSLGVSLAQKGLHGGCPKIRDTILRVPSVRMIVFGGLYWGPLM